jgi:hypothetical protein
MRSFVFFKSSVVFLCLSGVFVFSQPVMSFGAVSESHYSEVEVLLDEEFNLEVISSLARAPGSELEVLDRGKRVKVELESELVDALIEAGAKVGVSGSFALVEVRGEEIAPSGDAVIDGSCEGITTSGSNYNNYTIQDNTYGFVTACSLIPITGAPVDSTVRCLDMRWEIYHTWPADVVAALFDASWDTQYTVWYLEYEYGGYFGTSENGVWDFLGEPVNQTWEFCAGDWYQYDTGWINEWEITLYYIDFGGYCSVSITGCQEVIEQVQVGSINNDTGSGCGGYTDYTSLSTDMEIGVSYPITVNIAYGGGGDRVGVWVDWNQDHDFEDADETIAMAGNSSTGIYHGTITPPSGALTGSTRMRVRLQYDVGVGEEVPAEPCGSSKYGEVEDYTIVVIEEELLAGDMDGDGDVDLFDVDELCKMWLTDDVTCDIYPEGGDGNVDMQDFAVQAENYGL